MSEHRATIDIVVPCYNEGQCLPELFTSLREVVQKCNECSFHLILIDDGSIDETLSVASRELSNSVSFFSGMIVEFSRNFGKEAALLAGLRQSSHDACIIIDADLQDPPDLIPRMILIWREGAQIVNAVRSERTTDSFAKRFTAESFYKIFLALSKLKVQFNSSDYRLLDRVVIDAILSCHERVRFSKGFFAWAGFHQDNIYYDRIERAAGSGKWGSWRLWNYALDGIFSFSTAPLRIWTYVGIAFTALAFAIGLSSIVRTIIYGVNVPGYASIISAVTFLGGLQLVGIGILGEYLGRTYIETKRRPNYVIKKSSMFGGAMPGTVASEERIGQGYT